MTDEIKEFNAINEFLQLFDVTLEPRGTINNTDRELLTRIAEGSCNDEDRTQATELLATSSDAVEFFAQKLNEN